MYVVITAKPNTWYKAGSEVFWEDAEETLKETPNRYRRLTIEEHEKNCRDWGGNIGGFIGVHIIEDEIDARNRGCEIGEEVIDGEACNWDEFDITYSDEQNYIAF